MSEVLEGRNAIITGASRGLGLAIAKAMACAGANLLLVARSAKALEQSDGRMVNARVFRADLQDADAPAAIIEEARRHWSKLDILVNNAAIVGPIGAVWENDWREWEAALRVNLLAPVALCRLAAPWMKESGGGAILNISGGGATKARPRFSAYATAKAGLVRFSETLAEEAFADHIRVNCIAPGAMNTAMLDAVLNTGEAAGAGEYAQALKQRAQGGTPPETAAALCVFLASGEAAGITGRLISAVWDPWRSLAERTEDLRNSDIYTLRRIVPADRGQEWG
jgi:3-oxoacyl-[acyl-carrier protein] reductase